MGVKRRKERKEGGRKGRKERIAERGHVERIGEGEKGRSKEKERVGSQLAGSDPRSRNGDVEVQAQAK